MSVKCGSCGEFMADVTRITDDVTRMVCANVACARSRVSAPKAVCGDRIGLQVLQALGLPTRGVTSFSINFEPNEIVIVTVKTVVDKERLELVCEKYLAQLKACPDVSEPESAPPVTDAPVLFDRPIR